MLLEGCFLLLVGMGCAYEPVSLTTELIIIIIYPIFQNDRVAPKGMACTRVLPSTHVTKQNTMTYDNWQQLIYNEKRQNKYSSKNNYVQIKQLSG